MIDAINLILKNLGQMLGYTREAPMLFSSGLFWFLFLIFLPIYGLLKNSRTKMGIFTILFSLYFYYKSSGLFFILLIGTSLIDWVLSHAIYSCRQRRLRLTLMWLSVCCSLFILAYFKYANFFLWNWNMMVQGNFQPIEVILPVGISFYTFQSISYVVDVYKQRIKPTSRWTDYLFFLSFFPALVAGPIVRADYFLPQIRLNKPATHTMVWTGFWLIITGLIKKAVIADYISQYNDLVFFDPMTYPGLQSLLGIIGYTMQIYCDFSGYSDMAIGLALIMGFHLGINFDSPYKSRNLTEFWRRWHISLSSWLRDYVYIPLGGNRKGTLRTYINNFLTMLIGGLWHGAAWKFVFWGAMHGLGLAVHKACKPILKHIPDNAVINFMSWFITIVYVSLLWVFFRAESFSDSLLIISNIFNDFHISQLPEFYQGRTLWCWMMLIIIAMHFTPQKWADHLCITFIRSPLWLKLAMFFIVVQLIVQLMTAEIVPFIYFQF